MAATKLSVPLGLALPALVETGHGRGVSRCTEPVHRAGAAAATWIVFEADLPGGESLLKDDHGAGKVLELADQVA